VEPVAQFLIAVAAIFLIGAVGEMVFNKTFIPDAIWLIATGVLLGPILGWVSQEQLNTIAPHFAALTLVIVLFEGGSRIKLKQLAKVAPRAGLLAVLSFAFAVAVLTLVIKGAAAIGWLPKTWTWSHAILVGCILGGPSSIIIMPAMDRAKLAPSLANLVGLESAITDAFCVVGTAAMIDIMVAGSEASSPGLALLKSFGLATVIGMVSAFAWLPFLRKLTKSEHAYPITLAVLLLLYVAIDSAGGSAALGILCVAIMLGNAPSISAKFELGEGFELGQDVRGVHSRIAFFIKSLFFTFMGMMLGPPFGLMALGVVLAIFIALARVPAGLLATLRSDHDEASKKMVVLSLPRGMAAGVLATMPTFAGVPETEQLPVVVFSCIVATILLFAAGFPIIRKQLPTRLEGELRVGEVHHDLGGRSRHVLQIHSLDVEGDVAVVDDPGVALGARYGHRLPGAQGLGRVVGSDHGGDSQLARDDGRVTGSTAAVGHDRRRTLQDGLPVGRGGVGHEYVAGLEPGQLIGPIDDPNRAAGNPGSDGAAGREHAAGLLQPVRLECVRLLLGGDRLRAGLHDVELAIGAVLRPFDVHRTALTGLRAVVVLDADGILGEPEHLLVLDAEPFALGRDRGQVPGRRSATQPAVDHLQLLLAPPASQHRAVSVAKRGLVHVELVRIHGALHVEKALVLAGEAGIGQVFRRGR